MVDLRIQVSSSTRSKPHTLKLLLTFRGRRYDRKIDKHTADILVDRVFVIGGCYSNVVVVVIFIAVIVVFVQQNAALGGVLVLVLFVCFNWLVFRPPLNRLPELTDLLDEEVTWNFLRGGVCHPYDM